MRAKRAWKSISTSHWARSNRRIRRLSRGSASKDTQRCQSHGPVRVLVPLLEFNLLETMEAIRESGGKFKSLSEPWADTTTHAGKMIMTIFAGIAEFERDLIRERTGAGREAARKRGVRFGRPRKLNLNQEQLARRLVLEGKSVSDIARTFSVHVATIYRLAQVR
jgi:Resolvase, N terminal domain/Helix-turn-helix domain of resolvase